MSENCIFCKIIKKEINSNIVFEDNDVIGFKDLNPVSPTHVLFIPKKHIQSIDHLEAEDSSIISAIFLGISKYAKQIGISENGYRVVSNIGKFGGQTVFHLHFHLLGGRAHTWPPG